MNNIGLYIDADNISYKDADQIFRDMKNVGNIAIKKIFGDWSKTELKSWYNLIYKYGLEPMHCIRHNKKQSTDIYLITQMLNDVFIFPHISHYILASSDSDFIHLCQNLKRLGKKITIYGYNSSVLKNYCDNYIKLNNKEFNNKSKINYNELDEYLIEKMSDVNIISFSKFKKKLSNKDLNKYNKNNNNLETYIQNKTRNFLIYQKKKGHKKFVIYVGDILNRYSNKKELLNDKKNFEKKYNDLTKKINIQNLINKIF